MLDAQVLKMDEEIGSEKLDSNSSDIDTVEESDSETVIDSVSSHGGDSQTADDDKAEKVVRAPKREGAKKKPVAGYTPQAPNSKANRKTKSQQVKDSKGTPKRESKPEKGPTKSTSKNSPDNNPKSMKKVHPKPQSDSSEGGDIQSLDREKVIDVIDHASNGTHSVRSDDDSVLNVVDDDDQDKKAALEQKIQEMEVRIENLESELREVAALEIALYTVVPEHGSSAHKVHTPARRLSRLYIYACKHWTQDRRATVAKNTVSGLVLVSKSCGNDVSRLTFWLSNTIVLREIIYQAFGISSQSSPIEKAFESHRGERKSDAKSSSLKWKNSGRSRQLNKQGLLQFVEDWQETRTLTAALEKVESWIFSRIVESIWWQTLTPNMQSPTGGSTKNRIAEKLLGPSLGDQKQGDFSINLWRNAFNDALKRLCPVRAARHECGCLPILARKVMEQCVARLDVAMFNAILRESAFEIPTDPVSDPIVDPKVLPIPAGELSFGSGAQLKNSVGNWARWLSDFLGMDTDTSSDDETKNGGNDDKGKQRSEESKVFRLLNELSDLLMLPKDMLMDQTIRTEVCPSISLPLVKRILCNFTPDEFCPDPVPGAVLEIINAECIVDRRLSGEHFDTFPYAAASVVYTTPSSSDVSEKVLEADANPQLLRNVSSVQRKGYTSDQELDELEHCLSSIVFINKTSTSEINGIGNGSDREEEEEEEEERGCVNARYDLLREVWHAP